MFGRLPNVPLQWQRLAWELYKIFKVAASKKLLPYSQMKIDTYPCIH